MKKNKLIVIILIILVIVLSVVGFIFIKDKDTKKMETKKETYYAYVKINPLVKLTFDINYDCSDKDNCNVKSNKVTNVDLLNDDAKSIYTNLSYKDKKLEEVVASLINVADENNKDISNIIKVGDLSLDLNKYILKKNNKVIPLTSTELKILALMLKAPGKVFTKTQIYEVINGDYYECDDNTMMVHISNIRSKIEDNPSKPVYIKTVRGLGYKIENKSE